MMYLAYIKFETVFGSKISNTIPFAVIGTDSEDIYRNALKYGTDPHFLTGMIELNKDWDK